MAEPLIRRILVPVELAEPKEPDLSYALRLAAQLGAELVLFSAIDSPAIVRLIGTHRATSRSGRSETFNQGLVADAKAILQRIVDQASAMGVAARGHATVSDEVEEEILKEALVQRVDLILVYSHGRHGLRRVLFGSTAEDILKAAPCPVLVAPVRR